MTIGRKLLSTKQTSKNYFRNSQLSSKHLSRSNNTGITFIPAIMVGILATTVGVPAIS